MSEFMNCLPAPTWNRTGVNWAGEEASLPVPPSEGWGRAAMTIGALPAGVEREDTVPSICGRIAGGAGQAVDCFVTRNANTSCFLNVTEQAEHPITLTYALDKTAPAAIAHQAICAAADSSLTVIQVCRSAPDTEGIFASLTQIDAGAGARIRLVQIQMLGERCRHWDSVGIQAQKGAQVEVVRAVLGGAVSVCGTQANLAGRASRYDLTAIYFGAGTQNLDFNDTAVHTGVETVSEMHTAGVLAGQSRKILRGTIDFRSGAVRSVGHESEDVLIFSPRARNRTAPLILCGEEQVEGQHAATAGRLDERMLYYLTSRGLTPAQARRLMVEARFAPALDQIPDEGLREELLRNVERRLDSLAVV